MASRRLYGSSHILPCSVLSASFKQLRCPMFDSGLRRLLLHWRGRCLLDVLSVAELLLRVNITSFFAARLLIINPSLPCFDLGSEELFDLFQCLARGLWEAKKNVNEHGDVKTAEDEVSLPLDADECRWDEVAECEVEDPVRPALKGGVSRSANRYRMLPILFAAHRKTYDVVNATALPRTRRGNSSGG